VAVAVAVAVAVYWAPPGHGPVLGPQALGGDAARTVRATTAAVGPGVVRRI